jgi:putative flippase GtrA
MTKYASWFEKLCRSRVIRFMIVGLSNAAIGYGVFCIGVHLPIKFRYKAGASQLVAYAIGIGWSFFWNRRWTFQRTKKPVLRQGMRFMLLQIGLALVSSALLSVAVDHYGLPPGPSWLVVLGAITVANFVLSRYWVFQ